LKLFSDPRLKRSKPLINVIDLFIQRIVHPKMVTYVSAGIPTGGARGSQGSGEVLFPFGGQSSFLRHTCLGACRRSVIRRMFVLKGEHFYTPRGQNYVVAKPRSFWHPIFTGARTGVSRVLADSNHAWISLVQNLFHPRRAHEDLKERLLNGIRLDYSLQVANRIIWRSFGNRSAKAAHPVWVVRVPSRAICGENLYAAQCRLSPRIISK
jgi:hypothetical protein